MHYHIRYVTSELVNKENKIEMPKYSEHHMSYTYLTCPWFIWEGVFGHGDGDAPDNDFESSKDSSAADDAPPGLGVGMGAAPGVNDCCCGC